MTLAEQFEKYTKEDLKIYAHQLMIGGTSNLKNEDNLDDMLI